MEGQAGHGGLQPRDPSTLRISDEDRHKVAEVLRQAAGEGRIDLEELDERLEAAYGAKTYGDLVPITADLPAHDTGRTLSPEPAPSPVPATRHESSFSIMGDCSRRGVWEVPAQHNAFALMGSVTLDLRQARFTARETVIEAYAIMAGIEVIVNEHTHVVVEGVGIMGAFNENRARVSPQIAPDSPVVRVKGLALMAGVDVKRKPLPGTTRNMLGRPNR